MLTDTHCHLDMDRFEGDRESVIQRADAAGVRKLLVPSVNLASARQIVQLANAHEALYAAVGIHPSDVASLSGDWTEELQRLTLEAKVVAIGEIGLDYYWEGEQDARRLQRDVLSLQLELARRLHRPVILHMREERDAESGACSADLLSILADWISDVRAHDEALADRPGVLHSFSGSAQAAATAISLGFLIGVTGPITFRTAEARRRLIAGLPLERLVIETDSPFLAPEPYRGRRNEPAFVVHIADKIAEIQARTPREVAEVTSANAARLFAWEETV